MPIRTHELHPSLVHAPLVLLPAAAFADLAATLRPRDRRLDRMGRNLWRGAASAGLVAGLAGMAASQEIELRGRHPRDMMFAHGIANLGVVLAAAGVSAWRARNHANFTSALSGFLAVGVAAYSAYLGGALVYGHGAGVKPLGGVDASPPLFSRSGVARLGLDAGRGFGWLMRRGYRAVTSRERVERSALGPIAEAGTGAEPAIH